MLFEGNSETKRGRSRTEGEEWRDGQTKKKDRERTQKQRVRESKREE